jgi:hypothetical protein
MTLLGFLITFTLAVLVYGQPRRIAAIAMIAAVCYTTQGQVVNIAGLHFTSVRLILLAGFIRIASRGELNQLRLNAVDKIFIAYAIGIAVVSTLRIGTPSEFVYRLGVLFDVLLSYFTFRCFIRDEQDLRAVLAKVSFLIIPFALAMIYESLTARNPFSVLGGVYEFSWIRDGHVRASGAFRNPITAGAFGATFVMLFAGAWFAGMRAKQVLPGLIAAAAIAWCGRSSGPLLGLTLGLVALGCWNVRRQVPKLLWILVAVLLVLQFTMKSPVWFLIARAGDVFGGGGYHRAFLIDQFVKHFSSWWLAGTADTGDWFPYSLADGNADLTNRFVMDGVDAGSIGLILSVLLVVRCFQRLTLAIKRQRGYDLAAEKMLWAIGSTLVGTVGILFSVTYFDQMEVMWFFLLACIGGIRIRSKQIEARKTGSQPRKQPPRNDPLYVPEPRHATLVPRREVNRP